ncbi:MAG: SOS response-associated peptidase [Chitinophagaceae bacterium]|nr:MAG: SOS response-associated peptidase [Chitinophagaceae bacterium]
MCYYNGCRVSRADYIRLMGIEKELKNLRLNRRAQSGFDYRDWPIIKTLPGGKDFEIKEAHWEYIPASIYDEIELRDARIMNTWLNARGETLFKNDKGRPSMYRDGALNGRCLVLSSGFYEWRHVPKIGKKGKPLAQNEKIPYFITLKHRPEYFFMAGVSRVWTNHNRNQSADTFAIVTTEANELMQKVHNNKKRMPVILPEELAVKWLFGDLNEKEITELASYRYNAADMIAWPVEKGFVNKENPEEEFVYENLPAL